MFSAFEGTRKGEGRRRKNLAPGGVRERGRASDVFFVAVLPGKKKRGLSFPCTEGEGGKERGPVLSSSRERGGGGGRRCRFHYPGDHPGKKVKEKRGEKR